MMEPGDLDSESARRSISEEEGTPGDTFIVIGFWIRQKTSAEIPFRKTSRQGVRRGYGKPRLL